MEHFPKLDPTKYYHMTSSTISEILNEPNQDLMIDLLGSQQIVGSDHFPLLYRIVRSLESSVLVKDSLV